MSGRFSFAINFCATQLQANPCREVKQLPKNVTRGRFSEPDAPEAIKVPRVQKFKVRQTTLDMDLRHAVGMRLANVGESSR